MLLECGCLSWQVRPLSVEKIDNFYSVTVYEKGAEIIRTCAHSSKPPDPAPAAATAAVAIYTRAHNAAPTAESVCRRRRSARRHCSFFE